MPHPSCNRRQISATSGASARAAGGSGAAGLLGAASAAGVSPTLAVGSSMMRMTLSLTPAVFRSTMPSAVNVNERFAACLIDEMTSDSPRPAFTILMTSALVIPAGSGAALRAGAAFGAGFVCADAADTR